MLLKHIRICMQILELAGPEISQTCLQTEIRPTGMAIMIRLSQSWSAPSVMMRPTVTRFSFWEMHTAETGTAGTLRRYITRWDLFPNTDNARRAESALSELEG